MIQTPRIALLLLAALWLLVHCSFAAERPNILFFLVDDMGVTDTSVGFLYDDKGQEMDAPLRKRYRTPNMERLAAQGMRFANARAYSVCTPTRASILTGQDAPRLRITTWTHPKRPIDTGASNHPRLDCPPWRVMGIDPSLPTLPSVLAAAGYHTIHCGKAHFGPDSSPAGDPLKIGFKQNIAGFGGGGPGSYWGMKNFSAAWRNGGHDWDVPGLERYHGQDIFLTEALSLEMSDAIRSAVSKKEAPFFAYMSHYAVHAPFETDARFAGNYPDLKGMPLAFATLVEGMDKSLGDLIDTLDKLDVATRTLVVFFSDNGSDGPPNHPLRGKKGTRYDGGSRVPMIVSWAKPDPSEPMQRDLPIPAGGIVRDMVTPADFFPTLIRLAGARIPDDAIVDGHDISPYLRAVPGCHRPQRFAVHFPHGRHNHEWFSTWTEEGWKIIHQYNNNSWELYHLKNDPSEKTNLLNQEPERAMRLATNLIQYLRKVGAQFPINRNSGNPVLPDLGHLQKAIAE
ncbi:MAG: sulfatase-like hydrolase/transferase [Luteolibacter sp.]